MISVYQTVAQFKAQLNQWFNVPTQNMKLYYCDQVLVKLAGPEEMKWPNKCLYTYNVQEGDRFILDEKVPLTKLRTNSGNAVSNSSSPKVYGGNSPGSYRTAIQFGFTPYRMNPAASGGNTKPNTNSSQQHRASGTTSGVSRNLFGRSTPPSK